LYQNLKFKGGGETMGKKKRGKKDVDEEELEEEEFVKLLASTRNSANLNSSAKLTQSKGVRDSAVKKHDNKETKNHSKHQPSPQV
jgi:aminoglycoside N3'-acetyltransferase